MPNIIMADKLSGEWGTQGVLKKTEPKGAIDITFLPAQTGLQYNTGITQLTMHDFSMGYGYREYGQKGMTKLETFTIYSMSGSFSVYAKGFQDCTKLKTIDDDTSFLFSAFAFYNCTRLDTLILRKPSIKVLDNVNAFSTSCFKNGGSGGTIYIPETLYNHLGDGTNLDYKAANNWSTIDGYGTITWAKIEGSIYETVRADGTPIPSA